MSLIVRAHSAEFAAKRKLYQDLIASINIVARPQGSGEDTLSRPTPPRAAPGLAASTQASATPRIFSLSVKGRLGRMRSIAYCLPLTLPLLPLFLISGKFINSSFGLIMLLVAIAATVLVFTRLAVLRLHDVNRSGLWLIPCYAIILMLASARSPAMASMATTLATAVNTGLFYLLPGTPGENDYGPPTAPDTDLVIAGACILGAAQLILPFAVLFML